MAHPGLLGTAEILPGRHFWAVDLGGYWHPRSQAVALADVRVGWRLRRDSGYTFDVSAGLGYLHSVIAAETVNFDNNGYPGLMPVLDVGVLGWEWHRAERPVHHARVGLRIFGQYPVNTHWVTHPALTVTLLRRIS